MAVTIPEQPRRPVRREYADRWRNAARLAMDMLSTFGMCYVGVLLTPPYCPPDDEEAGEQYDLPDGTGR
uniref:Uncharacterized protein llpJ n=1 Tax=Streptomyces tendae TaxID=1932 RepID=A7DWI1_STRTE|nr:hypothetical protein [Streptomyces tendae]